MKEGRDQRTFLKEVLDIINNNDTAVAKALSILEFVARENNQINDSKDNENITASEMDFG